MLRAVILRLVGDFIECKIDSSELVPIVFSDTDYVMGKATISISGNDVIAEIEPSYSTELVEFMWLYPTVSGLILERNEDSIKRLKILCIRMSKNPNTDPSILRIGDGPIHMGGQDDRCVSIGY